MPYSAALHGYAPIGNYKITWGLATVDGTTGSIDVGLSMCLAIAVTPVTAAKVVNVTSTLPVAGSAVAFGCEGNTNFYFLAFGY